MTERLAAARAPRRLARRLTPAVVAAALLAPSAAHAAVTRTQITAPTASPTILVATATTSLEIAGHSNGGRAALDIHCDAGDPTVLVRGVVPNTKGNWSATLGARQLERTYGRACYLHALPAGSHADDRTYFRGIALLVDDLAVTSIPTGANAGAVVDFRLSAAQLAGRASYSSIGSCGMGGTALFQPGRLFQSTDVFGCSARLALNIGGRSAVQVDGVNAYAPATAASAFGAPGPVSTDAPGIASISYSAAVDPVTGNLTLRELEPLLRCVPDPRAFPPTAPTCGAFRAAGVRLDRTWAQDHDGRFTVVTDSWISTDGKPHRLDLAYETRVAAATPLFELPWLGGAGQLYGPGFAAQPPDTAPASVFVRPVPTATDGDRRYGLGALTFKLRPDSVRFRDPATLWLGYVRDVPAHGRVRFSFIYSRSTTRAELNVLAAGAQQALTPPPCVVPPVLGRTLRQARTALWIAHCALGRIERTYSTHPSGRVTTQRQRPGTTLPNNGHVAVVVSKGRRPHRG